MSDNFVSLTSAGLFQKNTPITVSAGASNANQIFSTNSQGLIDTSFFSSTLGIPSISVNTSEAIAAGSLVNVYNNSGAANARNANAATANQAQIAVGYVNAAVASGAAATVLFAGIISGLTGLTIGAEYYLSDSNPGAVVTGYAPAVGHCLQSVGFALSTTSLLFLPRKPIVIAS